MFQRLRWVLFVFFYSYYVANAQVPVPDTTTTLHRNRYVWHNCVVTKKDKQILTGYGFKYDQVAPKGKFYLRPKQIVSKRDYVSIKVKDISSVDYADLHYEFIQPIGSTKGYLAREAVSGKVTLYVYSELNRIPLPIPVAGAIISTAIPYNNSILLLKRDEQIVKVDRLAFLETMINYFADCPAVAQKIKNKTYRFRDMEALVQEYNASAR